jgi:hypothetical protein
MRMVIMNEVTKKLRAIFCFSDIGLFYQYSYDTTEGYEKKERVNAGFSPYVALSTAT